MSSNIEVTELVLLDGKYYAVGDNVSKILILQSKPSGVHTSLPLSCIPDYFILEFPNSTKTRYVPFHAVREWTEEYSKKVAQ